MKSRIKKSNFKDYGIRHFDMSFQDASELKLLVSASLASQYYAQSHNLPFNKEYHDYLLKLYARLDSLVISFIDDLPF